VPNRALILARISDARDGDERGVTDQVSDGMQLAERLGWGVGPESTHHIVENDTSAYKRKVIQLPDGRTEKRTLRPGFRTALAMLADGRADGLIAYDLDRLARQPRDLEDLIDLIEDSRPRIPVESVTGSLRLANDADVAMARVMVALANKSSRDTARRVSRARLRQASSGQSGGGGKRPFGWAADRVTVLGAEAAEIRNAADAILAGVSIRQVTASLRDRGVPTVTGAPWSTITVRDILLRPRNAGLMVHRPEGSGRAGPPYSDADIVGGAPWEPIIPEAVWRAVCAILTDPARRVGPGNTPRYLGSRIYFCGKCDDGTTVATSRSDKGEGRHTRYTCYPDRQLNDLPMAERRWHLSRAAALVDEFVEAVLVARLQRPDAAGLIPAPDEVDVGALHAEEASIRELLNEQARLHARRAITGEQLASGSRELLASLEAVRHAITAAEQSSPLAGIAGRTDAGEIWQGLDMGRKRAVLRVLAGVTLIAKPRRGAFFDPDSVQITWHQ
jgi:site-specific DNA recombinase